MQISLIAVFISVLAVKLLFLTVGVWFVVQGFRVHWGWGVANLLIPGAFIPFGILHPKESKKPMMLAGACSVLWLILWMFARHGSHHGPKVEVAANLPASTTSAALHLKIVSPSAETITGSLSLRMPVFHDGGPKGSYDEERLLAIQTDGFVMQFITHDGRGGQTNSILFPYGRITETNSFGWSIVGTYE